MSIVGKLRVISKNDGFRLVTDQGVIIEEADRFLSALEARGLSPLTIRAYAFDLLILYRWLCTRGGKEALSVRHLKQSCLLDFVHFQQQADAKPTSINRRLVVVNLLYQFLTGDDMSAGAGVSLPAPYYKGHRRDRNLGLHQVRNSHRRALRVKTPRLLVEPLTIEQIRLLIGSFKRYRDIAIVYLMLLCGLRSREVLALKVNDVDFFECRLLVLGKGNQERVLPLAMILLKFLRDYLKLERPPTCQTRALFVILQGSRRGKPMTVSGLRSLFRNRRLNEKIENANPHRLRHTFGADMARAGVRLPILQKMMGHSDGKMTLKYINLSMKDIAAEFQRAAKEIIKRYADGE